MSETSRKAQNREIEPGNENRRQEPPGAMDDAKSNPVASTPPDEVDWTGQVLGEFRLMHRIGRGGMGQVYLAEQTTLKRKVALKVLNPELAANERSLRRFTAEAENVARATHANIVQIYTIGQANGVHYLALEYVEGRNLREFIEKKGPPELSLGLHIMMQVAAALQRAGELGIIHRDIKPENILLTKKGEVKVADFGLSRWREDSGGEQLSLTQSQVTMGTPLYMSPEQVERRTVDSRTDIYSFGVTCYHMFAGTPPFKGNSPVDVAYQHVHVEPQPLSEVRPDLPADLFAIVHKMMAKKPADRYQSAGEIVRDINRLREGLNLGVVSAVSISSSFLGTDSRNLATKTWPGDAAPTRWIPRWLAVGFVVLALAGGMAIGWQHNHREVAPPKDPLVIPAPPEDGKKIVNQKAGESDLLRRVEECSEPTTELQLSAGMQNAFNLGMFYIRARRPDDAEKFFANLAKPEQKIPAYRFVGRLGHPIALAFKDEPAASNKEFLAVIGNIEKIDAKVAFKGSKKDLPLLDELQGYKHFWKVNQEVREMVARSLNRNFANDPQNFPAELEAYRYPPRPTLKAGPMP
ncbi:MAG TPA: serine/threonine-protein kinase [Gemmataceae bacterium]|nr:serine/threonine-protein kinase [Gemmataceae bacterium]